MSPFVVTGMGLWVDGGFRPHDKRTIVVATGFYVDAAVDACLVNAGAGALIFVEGRHGALVVAETPDQIANLVDARRLT